MDDPATIFHELGDPTRLRVLLSIIGGRKNVSMIVSELGLSQPQVSYHLRKLKDAGLAIEEKDGRWVWYQAHHGTDEVHLRELLDLMSRWAGAGSVRVPRRPPATRHAERAPDDEDRPRVGRPKKPAREMDDFLL